MPPRRDGSRWFYLAMSLLMLAIVTYGFSRTIGPSLLQAQLSPRLRVLLSMHGVVFYGWMLFFVLQCALVRLRNVRLHMLLGWFGVADGVLVIGMGLWATFAGSPPLAAEAAGMVSMAGFALPLALAVVWRMRPAYHRRLLLMSTAMLTNAAFARFPGGYIPHHLFYAGTDGLLVLGMAFDVWTERRVHVVYRVGLPLFLVAEVAVLIPAWPLLG